MVDEGLDPTLPIGNHLDASPDNGGKRDEPDVFCCSACLNVIALEPNTFPGDISNPLDDKAKLLVSCDHDIANPATRAVSGAWAKQADGCDEQKITIAQRGNHAVSVHDHRPGKPKQGRHRSLILDRVPAPIASTLNRRSEKEAASIVWPPGAL